MTLQRNSLGQLGFHVHYEGIVSEVDPQSFAYRAGLRQGSRLVEICKVATATLTHEQTIDLLRTSVQVKVVVIPPHDDGTPRRSGSHLALTYSTFLNIIIIITFINVINHYASHVEEYHNYHALLLVKMLLMFSGVLRSLKAVYPPEEAPSSPSPQSC